MLKEALLIYLDEDPPDPGWHHHLGEGDQGLTIAVELSPAERRVGAATRPADSHDH